MEYWNWNIMIYQELPWYSKWLLVMRPQNKHLVLKVNTNACFKINIVLHIRSKNKIKKDVQILVSVSLSITFLFVFTNIYVKRNVAAIQA